MPRHHLPGLPTPTPSAERSSSSGYAAKALMNEGRQGRVRWGDMIRYCLTLTAVCLGLALWTAGPNAPAAEPQLTVDLAQPGPAISPYLYGQFIEHLGRCIRDGVWAEKLRDRKFFLAPTNSPWQPVQPPGAACEVFHDPAGAYTGDHAMALWVRETNGRPCGLRQGGLGLLAGKEYVGYALLANAAASGASVEIRLAWGDGPNDGQSLLLTNVGQEYARFPFRFRAGATTESASLSVLVSAPAYLWLACLSLMPADNVNGLRADTLALIKQLNPPIIRWPGGNFVSGYNWKDAIGERDRRPPRWERAWNDVEDNDFGLDEFLAFCAVIGAEPYIAVNTGLGSAQDAADQVEYATASARTLWGGERARNGHAKPYKVTWWGVGNEMYGGWQLGHVSVEKFAVRHNAFVAAMKARNPNIKIIAVGAPGQWNDVLLPRCAAQMDLLSGHHYTERKFRVPLSAEDAARYEENFAAYSGDLAAGLRRLVTDFRTRLGRDHVELDRVRLAIDEWGIVRDWNAAPDAVGIGAFEHYYTLGDALAAGRGLHELIRSADLVALANWAQTVNVIGAIKTTRNHAALDPAGHLLALYRAHLSGVLVPVTITGNVPVDAVAGWDKPAGRLTLGLINYSPRQAVDLPVRLAGVTRLPAVTAWRIEGPDLGATNMPGRPESVRTVSLSDRVGLDRAVHLPAHSITLLRCEGVNLP
jgi:alpha-N-arabinofuranosidase